MAGGHRAAPRAPRHRQPVARRRAVQPGCRRLRPPHLPVRPVGVGKELLARRRARAVAARDRPAHRHPRPQLRLRAPARGARLAPTRRRRSAGRRSPAGSPCARPRPAATRACGCGSPNWIRASQGAVLRLDPVADREEYAELAALLVEQRPESLAELAAAEGAGARRLHLRLRNLGVEDWGVWARQDGGSVLERTRRSRRAVPGGGPRLAPDARGAGAGRRGRAARSLGSARTIAGPCSSSSTRRTTCARPRRATR